LKDDKHKLLNKIMSERDFKLPQGPIKEKVADLAEQRYKSIEKRCAKIEALVIAQDKARKNDFEELKKLIEKNMNWS